MPLIWDELSIGRNFRQEFNQWSADDFPLTAPATITGFSLFIADGSDNDNGLLDNFNGTMSWAILSNVSGFPGTVLYSGDGTPTLTDLNQQFLSNDISKAVLTLTAPISLTAGTYWVAFKEGTLSSTFDGSLLWLSYTGSAAGQGAVRFQTTE